MLPDLFMWLLGLLVVEQETRVGDLAWSDDPVKVASLRARSESAVTIIVPLGAIEVTAGLGIEESRFRDKGLGSTCRLIADF